MAYVRVEHILQEKNEKWPGPLHNLQHALYCNYLFYSYVFGLPWRLRDILSLIHDYVVWSIPSQSLPCSCGATMELETTTTTTTVIIASSSATTNSVTKTATANGNEIDVCEALLPTWGHWQHTCGEVPWQEFISGVSLSLFVVGDVFSDWNRTGQCPSLENLFCLHIGIVCWIHAMRQLPGFTMFAAQEIIYKSSNMAVLYRWYSIMLYNTGMYIYHYFSIFIIYRLSIGF